MKTTVDLPDDLVRDLKVMAAHTNRRLKDVIADVLRAGLDQPAAQPSSGRRVQLPLIEVAHPAAAADDLTADRVAGILVDQDVRDVR